MKAIICSQYGLPNTLEYKEVEDPKPKKGELLISIKACSVNFPDTLIIQGLYQFRPEPPFSPGSDFAGVVEEVGEGVSHFKVGDEVVGFNPYGGFAEKVTAPANVCFPKPKGMNMVNASAFLMAYGTSYHALKDRGQVKEGDTVLVLGASGGVGITAVELAKLMGAKVIAAASTDEKLELCFLGSTHISTGVRGAKGFIVIKESFWQTTLSFVRISWRCRSGILEGRSDRNAWAFSLVLLV